MKRILILLGIIITSISYSQIDSISNGESGLSARNKINRAFDTINNYLATNDTLQYYATNTSVIDSLRSIEYLKFNNQTGIAYQEGILYYDTTVYTLVFYNQFTAFSHQLGHELVMVARNTSGSTIVDGSPVFICGATGQLPEICKANANHEDSANVAGFTTIDILNNDYGIVTIEGIVNGINTSGITEGKNIYLSRTAPYYDTVQQLAPYEHVLLGTVIYSHAINGRIQLNITHLHKKGRTNSIPYYNGNNEITEDSTDLNFDGDTLYGKNIKNQYGTVITGNPILSDVDANDTTRWGQGGISFESISRTIYYDQTNGNDTTGNGSSGSPFRTLKKAIKDINKIILDGVDVTLYGLGENNYTFTNEHLRLLNDITIYGDNYIILRGDTTNLASGISFVNYANNPFIKVLDVGSFTPDLYQQCFLVNPSTNFGYPIHSNTDSSLIIPASANDNWNTIDSCITNLYFDVDNRQLDIKNNNIRFEYLNVYIDNGTSSNNYQSIPTLFKYCNIYADKSLSSFGGSNNYNFSYSGIYLTNASPTAINLYDGILTSCVIGCTNGTASVGVYVNGEILMQNIIISDMSNGIALRGNAGISAIASSLSNYMFVNCGTMIKKMCCGYAQCYMENIYLDNVDYIFDIDDEGIDLNITDIAYGTYDVHIFSSTSTYTVNWNDSLKIYLQYPNVSNIKEYDPIYYFAIALSDSLTELTTANGDSWDAMCNYTIDSVRIGVNKAPTGSTLSVDIKNGGTSIFSTLITIDAGETTSVTAATPYVISTADVDYNDRMQAIVSSAGATYGGAGLKVYIYGTKD